MDANTLITAIISCVMVLGTTMMFYEIMRFVWAWLPKPSMHPRYRVLIVMIAIFFSHTVAVWLYAFLYWGLTDYAQIGSLSGEHDGSLMSYVYFSAATYSSLGVGDIFPHGPLRFLAGVQVINGLVLIACSASFIYLTMEKFWDLHPQQKKKVSERTRPPLPNDDSK